MRKYLAMLAVALSFALFKSSGGMTTWAIMLTLGAIIWQSFPREVENPAGRGAFGGIDGDGCGLFFVG
jgi:hypothetical protein